VSKKRVFLPVVSAAPGGVSRRHLIQGILAATGVGVTVGAEADTHQHAPPDGTAKARPATAPARPRFLSPHQFETLAALAERIVPGSRTAQVAAFIDGQLAIEAASRQQQFLEALSHFENLAIDGHTRPFRALSAPEQDAILEAASTMEFGSPQDDRNWGWFSVPSTKAPGPPTYSSRDHFEQIKTRVSGAYYSSETGMRELGWTGQTYFAAFPGCTHPDGHE
jgi:hypothetical protein